MTVGRFQASRLVDGEPDFWVWRATQSPPWKRRAKSRRRNKAARVSRKKNR